MVDGGGELDHKDQMYEERQNTQTKSTVISRVSKWAVDHDGRGFSDETKESISRVGTGVGS